MRVVWFASDTANRYASGEWAVEHEMEVRRVRWGVWSECHSWHLFEQLHGEHIRCLRLAAVSRQDTLRLSDDLVCLHQSDR